MYRTGKCPFPHPVTGEGIEFPRPAQIDEGSIFSRSNAGGRFRSDAAEVGISQKVVKMQVWGRRRTARSA